MSTIDPGGMLLDCYRTYIGSLDEVGEVDVFVGVGLTGGGLLLALVGWVAFLWNDLTAAYGTTGFYTVRELSVAAAGLGLPLLLLGVVVMMLGTDRVTAVAVVGQAVCLGAVLLFVATYPEAWNVGSHANAPIGVSLYGLGAFMLAFAAGAAYSCRVTGAFQIREGSKAD